MAEQDRESLITYLWDVASTELLCRKIEEEIACLEQDSKHCQAAAIRVPLSGKQPQRVTYHPDAGVILFLAFGMVSLSWLLLAPLSTVKKLLAFVAAMFWLCGAAQIWREEQAKLDQKFQKECDCYESQRQYNAGLWEEARRLEGRIVDNEMKGEILKKQWNDAQNLRKELYAVKRIPLDFCNCAGACYLYLMSVTREETELDQWISGRRPQEIQRYMEGNLCLDWENMLLRRWEEALWEVQHREEPSQAEGLKKLHQQLNQLLLTTDF